MKVMILKNRDGKVAGISIQPEGLMEQSLLLMLQKSKPFIDVDREKYPVRLSLTTKDW